MFRSLFWSVWIGSILMLAVSVATAQLEADTEPDEPPHDDDPVRLQEKEEQQEQQQTQEDRARELSIQGIIAFKHKDYETSVARFEAAEALLHAPSHLYFLGRAQTRMGQLLQARVTLQKLVDEALPVGASESDQQTQELARKMVTELTERIPQVTVTVLGAQGDPIVVVDGERAAWSTENRAIELEPGEHDVVAKMAGQESDRFTVVLKEYDRAQVVLRFLETKSPRRIPANSHSTFEARPSMAEVRQRRRPLIWGAFGVATAGAIGGTVTGLISWHTTRTLKPDCYEEHKCGPSTHERLDLARQNALASNVSFLVAVAGAGVGLFSLFVPPAGSRTQSGRSAALPKVVAQPGAASGRLDLRWDFR